MSASQGPGGPTSSPLILTSVRPRPEINPTCFFSIYMHCYFACMCMKVSDLGVTVVTAMWVTAMWVLGFEPGSSERAVSVLNY